MSMDIRDARLCQLHRNHAWLLQGPTRLYDVKEKNMWPLIFRNMDICKHMFLLT